MKSLRKGSKPKSRSSTLHSMHSMFQPAKSADVNEDAAKSTKRAASGAANSTDMVNNCQDTTNSLEGRKNGDSHEIQSDHLDQTHPDLGEGGSGKMLPIDTANISIPIMRTSGLDGIQCILAQMKEDRIFLAGEIERNAKEIRLEIQAIGNRTAALEVRVEAVAKAHNDLLIQSSEWGTRLDALEVAYEDLINRSRRNNIKIRGIPETRDEGPVQNLVLEIFRPLQPDIPEPRWEIDRAHRLSGGLRRNDERPRDIIVRFHYHSTKDAVVRKCRGMEVIYREKVLQIFQDLSPSTLLKRRQWKPIADHLRLNHIPFAWGHPFKLLAFHNEQTRALLPTGDPSRFFQTMGLDTPEGVIPLFQQKTPLPTLPREWFDARENQT
ncbi:Hypothetical predicted protein [Pelobates cultripes]|uniref:Uncharacterized protein n=1 Tax=Pelobates cultripes TaxID=61616 RepID=A0AAD1W599_PELCU|nr:Hypothetical predicted protein [Pelobates cultripes]